MVLFINLTQGLTASDRGWGLGVILGEPTGISFKNWQTDTRAIDAAVAWSFGKKDAFHLHGDYLIHNFQAIRTENTTIPLYYGIGARIKFREDIRLGARFPLGINFFFREVPLDMFIEFVPILNLTPATELDLNAALGFRYYFR